MMLYFGSFLVLIVALLFLPLEGQVRGQLGTAAVNAASGGNVRTGSGRPNGEDPHHLTKYILQRLLGEDHHHPQKVPPRPHQKRPLTDREAAEARIFSDEGVLYTTSRGGRGRNLDPPIRRYLDEAKEQIEVIDFRGPRKYHDVYIRRARQDDGDLSFSDGGNPSPAASESSSSASEQVPVKLAFPGNEYNHQHYNKAAQTGCVNCIPDGAVTGGNRWKMPLQTLGSKQYYLGIFFKANWYKAEQYCRFHGMHLASINNAEEQKNLQEHIQAVGMGHEHFWTSGTDQGEEGKFFWMSTGRPITFENWNAGEPNNFEYEDGEQEHCLEMWDRDGKGLGWNDTPCSFSTFFVCEA